MFLWSNQYIEQAGGCKKTQRTKKIPKWKRKSLAQVLIIKLIRWDSVLHQIAISAIIFIVSILVCECVKWWWWCGFLYGVVVVCVRYGNGVTTQLDKRGKHTWLTLSEWRKNNICSDFHALSIHIHLQVGMSVCHTKRFRTLLFGNGDFFFGGYTFREREK